MDVQLCTEFTDWSTDNKLPSGWNTHSYGNKEGIEIIWTIDWYGGDKEYIAAKARKWHQQWYRRVKQSWNYYSP